MTAVLLELLNWTAGAIELAEATEELVVRPTGMGVHVDVGFADELARRVGRAIESGVTAGVEMVEDAGRTETLGFALGFDRAMAASRAASAVDPAYVLLHVY